MVPFCLLRFHNWRMWKKNEANTREKKPNVKDDKNTHTSKKAPYDSYHLLETARFIFASSLFWWCSWFWFIGPRGIITAYFFAFFELSSLFVAHSFGFIHALAKVSKAATAFATPVWLCDQIEHIYFASAWYTAINVFVTIHINIKMNIASTQVLYIAYALKTFFVLWLTHTIDMYSVELINCAAFVLILLPYNDPLILQILLNFGKKNI